MSLVLVWGFKSPMAQTHWLLEPLDMLSSGLASLGKTGTQAFSVIGASQFALSTAALRPSAEKQVLLRGPSEAPEGPLGRGACATFTLVHIESCHLN